MSFQVMLQQLTTGFGQTLLIFFLTLLFSLPLGMVVYFGRVSRFKPLSWIVKAYISIMRGTPLMLQLLLWYFGPFYLWGMNIGNYKFTAIILGCSLNYAAYFAEIYRSGIESIPVGQYEAAQLLGSEADYYLFATLWLSRISVIPCSVTEKSLLVKHWSHIQNILHFSCNIFVFLLHCQSSLSVLFILHWKCILHFQVSWFVVYFCIKDTSVSYADAAWSLNSTHSTRSKLSGFSCKNL